jgi:hypothetical protein
MMTGRPEAVAARDNQSREPRKKSRSATIEIAAARLDVRVVDDCAGRR